MISKKTEAALNKLEAKDMNRANTIRTAFTNASERHQYLMATSLRLWMEAQEANDVE